MGLMAGLDNDVLIVFFVSLIIGAYIIKLSINKLFYNSRLQRIHPENEVAINEIRQLRPVRLNSGDSDSPDGNTCPICLDNISYRIETNCGHRFCGQCFCTYWQQRSPFSQPNCPVCRGQFVDQLRDLPSLVSYGVRALFDGDGEGISWFLRLRLIVLSLFVFFYVISPLDIFPESVIGAFGLLDDALVCLIFLVYFAAYFRRRLATAA